MHMYVCVHVGYVVEYRICFNLALFSLKSISTNSGYKLRMLVGLCVGWWGLIRNNKTLPVLAKKSISTSHLCGMRQCSV